jgi:hypothetical protein
LNALTSVETVELVGEIERAGPEDLTGLAQPSILALECLQPLSPRAIHEGRTTCQHVTYCHRDGDEREAAAISVPF